MSEEEAIPFANQQASGQEVLAGGSPFAANVVLDGLGCARRRPGIALWNSAQINSSAISGLYSTWAGRVFAVGESSSERPLYEVTATLNTLLPLYSTEIGAGLAGDARPVFAETEMLVVIAGGLDMQKIVLNATATSRLGGSPPKSSHVIATTSRLVANDVVTDLSNIRYSDIANGTTSFAGLEVWSSGVGTAGFFAAEARPDPVLALHENTNEIFAFGTTSLQNFGADAQFVFAPTSVREFGISAPYSVIKMESSYAWLDQYRRFVAGDGRQNEVISDPIKATLDELTVVSDCYGYRYQEGPFDVLVWVFPTDGRSFAFQKGSGWSVWTGFAGGNWGSMGVASHTRLLSQNLNLVGTSDGYVGKLTTAALDDRGIPINARLETGYIGHKTQALKECKVVRFVLRRGRTTSTTGPVAFFGFRDRPGAWECRIPIDLGSSGDTEPVLEFRSLGTYRRRQWFFEFSGPEELVLVSAMEEYEVLSH